MTFNYRKQNKTRGEKDKALGGKKKKKKKGRGRKREGSKSDFAVQWCGWIIMKMKATESGSIRKQGNGAQDR